MLARLDREEDVSPGKDGRDRVDAARKGLAEQDHVGLDGRVVLEAEELSSTGESLVRRTVLASALRFRGGTGRESAQEERTHGLDLVANEEDIVLPAQRLHLLEVVLVRDDDTVRSPP